MQHVEPEFDPEYEEEKICPAFGLDYDDPVNQHLLSYYTGKKWWVSN